jgi:F-type H+-transporting ATPase subunit a
MMSSITLAADPVQHVINHATFINEDGWWLWSTAQTNMVITAAIMLFVGLFVAASVSTGQEGQGHARWVTNNRFAHMIEVICGYLRENTVRPLIGKRTNAMMPFLWTIFFFILVNNVLGLIPLLDFQNLIAGKLSPEMVAEHRAFIGGTATQSIWVTGALALISAIVINAAGIKELGLGGYLKHLTAEAPIFVWPIIIPIEIMGTFIKPIALAIRLFANMTAGHILVAVLLGFAAKGFFSTESVVVGIPVGIVSSLGIIAIYFLELFVAFLQAFVFMFLTTVFISLLEHHGDHDHDTAHEIAEAGLA